MNTLIRLQDAILRNPAVQFSEPLNWEIQNGEHWAVIGPNGAGKTLLIDTLTGKYALKSGTREYPYFEATRRKVSESVISMAFRDISSLSNDYGTSTYQQRWNTQEAEESPFIKTLLKRNSDKAYSDKILELFSIKELLNSRLIELSSGELRKFLIVRTLMNRPRILILDNPFIGLDEGSRNRMNDVLENLAAVESLQLVFVLSNPDDIPDMVTHVLPIHKRTLMNALSRSEFLANFTLQTELFPLMQRTKKERVYNKYTQVDFATAKGDNPDALSGSENTVVQLCNIYIHYGKRTILKDLNWIVKRGEKWALLGPNGAGKSTLLSVVCADNPQSYANDVRLFNRKRGSGESIWDIKKHIGYVSPEMHSYYMKNVPCRDIVGSGLFDTIGLYRKCNTEQLQSCEKWMATFDILHLKDKSFMSISSGEQRLCLLARAFVKEPTLLILDEPLHGLDVSNKLKAKKIIEDYSASQDKTLIYVTHYIHEIPDCINNQFLLIKNK